MKERIKGAVFLLWLSCVLECGGEVLDLSAFEVVAGGPDAFEDMGMGLPGGLSGEVRVDLQSRGGTRYQTDVVIRGGIFEGTGVQIGSLVILDPQTGHYGMEVPLDGRLLTGARLMTGAANAFSGVNATAGTLTWEWADGGVGGEGQVILRSHSGIGGSVLDRAGVAGGTLSWALESESGDGSIFGGDYDLEQVSAMWEGAVGAGRLRIFGGHLRKAYGWPAMYTGYASLYEFETYAVSLLGMEWSGVAGHRLGAYWRYLEDDYEYNRYSPNRFFEHETKVLSIQGTGAWGLESLELGYRWAVVQDEILASTSLVNGRFSKRRYGKAALKLSHRGTLGVTDYATYGGVSLDSSTEEATVLLPYMGFKCGRLGEGVDRTVYVEVSKSSQVPGYTALSSGPDGLFGGNAALGREEALQVEVGVFLSGKTWDMRAVLFNREDMDLVDWVYALESPSARQATAMDGEVNGLEVSGRFELGQVDVEYGYAWLEKSPEYGEELAGSFYYLNYARQRFDLLARLPFWLGAQMETTISARELFENPLRDGTLNPLQAALALSWKALPIAGMELVLRCDNISDERYEVIPGTPGAGREFQAQLTYRW